MNAAAYALQFCRFRRSKHGVIDAATGELSPYAQLAADVQRVSESLRTHGFREGAVVRVCSHAASRSLLVLTLSVWNLVGTIEVDSAIDGNTEDLGATGGETDTLRPSQVRTRHWLVCDAAAHVQRHCSQLTWTPEKIIVVEPGDSRTGGSGCITFADLLTSRTASPIALSRVPSGTVALRVLRSDGSDSATTFTHFQVIESVERSLQGLSSELLGNDADPLRAVLNALPFNHTGCLCVGLLPAIVLDVSVLPLNLSSARAGMEDLAKHFAAHSIATVVIAPEALAQLSECRTLRTLETTALEHVLCVGAPTPTLPRALKCLATWRDDLTARRIFSTSATLGAAFATDDLLAPIRQKTASLYQELGQPLMNVHADVTKPRGLSDESDVYELTLVMLSAPARDDGDVIATGVYVTVSWESDSVDTPQLNVVATSRERDRDFVPVLPIEELIASHPLVADVAILPSRVEALAPLASYTAPGDCSASALTVYVSLTPGARKYASDSLTTIQSFVMKKLAGSDDAKIQCYELVDRVDRDVYGRTGVHELVQRLADNWRS